MFCFECGIFVYYNGLRLVEEFFFLEKSNKKNNKQMKICETLVCGINLKFL